MEYNEALIAAKNGHAVLFYGAGFTFKLKSYKDYEVPNGVGLSRILSSKLGEYNTDELQKSSNAFRKVKGDMELINLLNDYFIFDEMPRYYNSITTTPWKSIYTTNYDNSFEVSAMGEKLYYESIDLSAVPRDYVGKKKVLHINGFIKNLSKEHLNTSFKLTNVSYLTASFKQSNWSKIFERDLRSAEAIFFVGYSLYDLDIQEIIYNLEGLKDKIFFIDKPSMTQEEIMFSGLEDFGKVLSIGVKKFAEDLRNVDKSLINNKSYPINSFDELYFNASIDEPTDNEVSDLILKGEINTDFIFKDVISPSEDYIIRRSILDKIINYSNTKENFVIFGGLANGKTILSYQILSYFQTQGYVIYQLKDDFLIEDIFNEISHIINHNIKSIFLIENYTSKTNLDVLAHINDNRNQDTKVILTARTFEHEKIESTLYHSRKIIDINSTYEIDVDTLTSNDLLTLMKKFESHGLWSEYLFSRDRDKISYLSQKTNSQFHGVLLEIFNSPQVRNRFTIFYKEMLNSTIVMKNITAIMCLSLSNIAKPNFEMVESLTNTGSIFEPNFRESLIFRTLITEKEGGALSKSAVLAQFLLQNFPNQKYLVENLIEIAKNAYNQSDRNYGMYMDFYRYMAAFRNIQTMLPEKGRRESLIQFYDGLKRSVVKETSNPLFWLQYAIARLSFSDQDKDNLRHAKSYLDQSLKLARKRSSSYWTDDIETQMARCYFLQSINIDDESYVDLAMQDFNNGVSILSKLSENKNRLNKEIFRPMKEIKNFYIKFENHFSLEQLDSLKLSSSTLKKIIDKHQMISQREKHFVKAKEAVEYVITNIEVKLHIIKNS